MLDVTLTLARLKFASRVKDIAKVAQLVEHNLAPIC